MQRPVVSMQAQQTFPQPHYHHHRPQPCSVQLWPAYSSVHLWPEGDATRSTSWTLRHKYQQNPHSCLKCQRSPFSNTVKHETTSSYAPDADTSYVHTRHCWLHFHVTIKFSAPTSVFYICLTDYWPQGFVPFQDMLTSMQGECMSNAYNRAFDTKQCFADTTVRLRHVLYWHRPNIKQKLWLKLMYSTAKQRLLTTNITV